LQIAITISQFAIKASEPKKYFDGSSKTLSCRPFDALIDFERTAGRGGYCSGEAQA
jgi:hypothetical protein